MKAYNFPVWLYCQRDALWVTQPAVLPITHCEATSAEAILRGCTMSTSHTAPQVKPCQSQAMWLQKSPPALSLTPPIDFPSLRSVSLNHFIQGDPPPPTPSAHTLDRLICGSLAGFNTAMTFIHLSMYILPDCMVPSLINSLCTLESMALSTMSVCYQNNVHFKRREIAFELFSSLTLGPYM